MNDRIFATAAKYAEISRNEELALLKKLAAIPSPSHHEERRARFIYDWLVNHGAHPEDVRIDAAKNAIFLLGAEKHRSLIVFQAHTDIVFPDESELPLREEGDRLYAPGVGDDTANLVGLLFAVKYLLDHNLEDVLDCGFLIAANACEEGLGNLDGTKAIFEEYGDRIVGFYSFDGYVPQCTTSAVGSYRYRITCTAGGGHSYFDFGKPNAVELLCGLVERLYQIDPPAEAPTTFNVGRIEGGTTVNSIPQSASILFEFRSPSQTCLDEMRSKFENAIHECLHRLDHLDGTGLKVELLGIRPGTGKLNEAEELHFTKLGAEVIRHFTGMEPDCSPASTDANIPFSLEVPANTIGTIRGGRPHTRDEWLDESSLPDGLAMILSLMLSHVKLDR